MWLDKVRLRTFVYEWGLVPILLNSVMFARLTVQWHKLYDNEVHATVSTKLSLQSSVRA